MPRIRHLLLVRHGETQGNLDGIAHGRSESPLNERGIEQARLTGQRLVSWERRYHRVFASPLERAHDTGRHIAEALALPLAVHDDLVEAELGVLDGVTYRELDEFGYAKRSIADDDFRGHDGESPNELAARMERAWTELGSRHPGENLILVSHGAALSHLVARLLRSRPAFGPQYIMRSAALTELTFREGIELPELSALNDHGHLPEHLTRDPARRRD